MGALHIRRFPLAIVLCWFVLTACSDARNSQASSLKIIRGLMDQQDYPQAETKLQQFIAVHADSAPAWHLMGEIQTRQKKNDLALASFSKALVLDRNLVDAHQEQAKLWLAAKRYDQARIAIEAALTLAPRRIELLHLKGALAVAEGHYETADQLLTPLLTPLNGQNQANAQTYLLLAAAKSGLNDSGATEKVLKDGIVAFPRDAALQLELARFYSRAGRTAEAIAIYHGLMAAEPQNQRYPMTLAAYYWETKQPDQADEIFNGLMVKEPKNPQWRLLAAKFYLERRAMKQAETVLTEGVKADPHEFQLLQGLCDYHLHHGNPTEAIEMLLGFMDREADLSAEVEKNVHLALAKAYFQQNDLDQALQHSTKTLQIDLQNPEALYLKGRIHAGQGNTDLAISAFSAVLARRPNFTEGYLALGQAYLAIPQYDHAVAVLQKGVQAAPRNKQLRLALAKVQLARKDYKAVENELVQVLQIDPSDDKVQAELGDFYVSLKEYDRAEREYAEIIQKNPEKGVGYIKLAKLYALQNDAKGAVAELLGGYRRNENSPELAIELVQTYLTLDKADAALEVCRKRLTRNNDEALSYYLIGQIQTHLKKFKEAEEAMLKAVGLSPQWPAAANGLANLYLLQGKQTEAIRGFEASLEKNSKNDVAYLSLGRIYENAGQFGKAITNYERALTHFPNLSQAACRLAFLLCERQETPVDLERAYQLALNANQHAPGTLETIDTLAWIYHRRGEQTRALPILQNLVQQFPNHSLLNYHLAMTLLETGKAEDARRKLEVALKDKTPFIGRNVAEKTFRKLKAAS